jgi:hypothetical protein
MCAQVRVAVKLSAACRFCSLALGADHPRVRGAVVARVHELRHRVRRGVKRGGKQGTGLKCGSGGGQYWGGELKFTPFEQRRRLVAASKPAARAASAAKNKMYKCKAVGMPNPKGNANRISAGFLQPVRAQFLILNPSFEVERRIRRAYGLRGDGIAHHFRAAGYKRARVAVLWRSLDSSFDVNCGEDEAVCWIHEVLFYVQVLFVIPPHKSRYDGVPLERSDAATISDGGRRDHDDGAERFHSLPQAVAGVERRARDVAMAEVAAIVHV